MKLPINRLRAAPAWLAPLLLLALATVFADAPLFHGLPLGDDTELHLYRLVELDRLLRQGILYSRWEPDLVFGYGAPLFGFYAPLSAYLAEFGHLLGLTFRDGLRLAFAAMPLIAASATYAFLRRRLAPGPAGLAAIAYVAGPYFLYNLYVRGSISDSLAMALFPVVLLALDRLVDRPSPGALAALALAYGALLLSHNVSGPLFLPLLIAVVVWWSWGSRRRLVLGGLGLVLGIGLAGFFLGPAALGASSTRVPALLGLGDLDYHKNFVALSDLFVPFAVARPGAVLTDLPIGLGLVQTLLALAALVGLPSLKSRLRGEAAIFALALLVCAGLTLPLSLPLWDRIGLLRIVQLPWRFLSIAAFADALLVGYTAQAFLQVDRPIGRSVGLGVIGLVLLLLAVPYLYPRSGSELPAGPDLADVTAFQLRARAYGVTSNSEFLPAGLRQFPSGPPFPGADQGASLARKLDRSTLPPDATVQPRADGPLAARLEVNTPASFVARFFVFRFPGWSLALDGRTVPPVAPGADGTLAVQVPAGQHLLDVAFVETRSQRAFDLVSLVAALVVVGAALSGFQAREGHPMPRPCSWLLSQRAPSTRAPSPVPASIAVAPLVVAAVLVIGLTWGVFDRTDTPLVRWFDGQHPPGMAVAARHQFGPSIELLGYTQSQDSPRPGESTTITLYWTTRAPLPVDYSSFLHLVDRNGQNLAVADNTHPAGLPTTRWPVGAYAPDVHTLELPPTLPPGRYRVEVGIYDRASGKRLPMDPDRPGGDTRILEELAVGEP